MATGELLLLEPDQEDRSIIADLLERHRSETGSEVAAALLADLPASLDRFTKVLPRDYDAVLTTRAAVLEEGLDPDGDTAWARILEATRG